MISTILSFLLINIILFSVNTDGFSVVSPNHAQLTQPQSHLMMSDWDGDVSGGGTGVQQIIFKIHVDGRVEETVKGVKGVNCQKVTEEINEKLGKVVISEPTEEMYEQEIVIDQTITITEGTTGSDWEGGSSW